MLFPCVADEWHSLCENKFFLPKDNTLYMYMFNVTVALDISHSRQYCMYIVIVHNCLIESKLQQSQTKHMYAWFVCLFVW